MTSKDYDLIAACIGAAMADSPSIEATEAIVDLTRRLKLEMGLQNPRFNVPRFDASVLNWMQKHGGK